MRAVEDFSEVSKKFDCYGSITLRDPNKAYLNLTQLTVSFIPTDLPNFFHHYYDMNGVVNSDTFRIESTLVFSVLNMNEFLSPTIGLHYLSYVELQSNGCLRVKYRTIGINTVQDLGSIVKPKTMTEWSAEWKTSSVDLSRYPRKCRRCQAPAYIGLNLVDCSAGCR